MDRIKYDACQDAVYEMWLAAHNIRLDDWPTTGIHIDSCACLACSVATRLGIKCQGSTNAQAADAAPALHGDG